MNNYKLHLQFGTQCLYI